MLISETVKLSAALQSSAVVIVHKGAGTSRRLLRYPGCVPPEIPKIAGKLCSVIQTYYAAEPGISILFVVSTMINRSTMRHIRLMYRRS